MKEIPPNFESQGRHYQNSKTDRQADRQTETGRERESFGSLTAEVDTVGSGGDGACVGVRRAAGYAAVPGDVLLVEPGIARLTSTQAVRLMPRVTYYSTLHVS